MPRTDYCVLMPPGKVDGARRSAGRGGQARSDWPPVPQADGRAGRRGARAERRPRAPAGLPGTSVGAPVGELGGAKEVMKAWPRECRRLIFLTRVTSRARESIEASLGGLAQCRRGTAEEEGEARHRPKGRVRCGPLPA